MANPEHVEIVKSGAHAIRKWRKSNPGVQLCISGADLAGVNLAATDLAEANLKLANLSNANLSEADLTGADLSQANLSKADLSRATLSRANLINADLSEANLTTAILSEAYLSATKLTDANLSDADLSKADILGARLTNANFTRATFYDANVMESEFKGVNFTGAKFSWAVFRNCNLGGANFSTCICEYATFASTNFANCLGLQDVIHQGPSTIGIDTIIKSAGRVSETFLRGCGVSDSIIAMIPSLVGSLEPIQFYSCFISYSHNDEEFSRKLHSRLQQEKLRVWYAPEDMKLGQKLHEQIESAIRVHDKLLLVLSEASMNSEWVKTEIAHARQREVKEGKRVLFPISLVPFDAVRAWKAFDADTGKDMAREIREYLVGDFSNWKDHDSFEKGFQRLLRDLRAEGAKEAGE